MDGKYVFLIPLAGHFSKSSEPIVSCTLEMFSRFIVNELFISGGGREYSSSVSIWNTFFGIYIYILLHEWYLTFSVTRYKYTYVL